MFKCPFYIKEEFLSPLLCEKIIEGLAFDKPDVDKDDNPIKTSKTNDELQSVIFERFQAIKPEIQNHFDIELSEATNISFDLFPESCDGETSHCENSVFVRNKWLRNTSRDLTAVLFLTDYQEKLPFDNAFEAYGGKLEFPQHQFGFNSQRGTLVVFSSGPHFINNTTPIQAGNVYRAKFHLAATKPYLYNPEKFPGTYENWFNT